MIDMNKIGNYIKEERKKAGMYSWVLLCFTTTDVGSNFSPFLFITSKLTFALLSSA